MDHGPALLTAAKTPHGSKTAVTERKNDRMKDRQTLNCRGELLNVRMQQTGTIAEPASLNRMAKEAPY